MKKSLSYKNIIIAINFVFVLSCGSPSLEASMQYPMKVYPMVSGSLGEFRYRSLHMGLDNRTFGINNIPVYATTKGWLHRLYGNPYGFGKAIYLQHEGGYVSTYGHIGRLGKVKGLDAAWNLFNLISTRSWFSTYFPKKMLRFDQNDVIAFSGDKGKGPSHLHFEVWDNKNRALNPLTSKFLNLPDNQVPKLFSLYVYTPYYQIGKNRTRVQRCKLKLIKKRNRLHSYKCSSILYVDGNTGIKISMLDYINNSPNKLGAYSISMFQANTLQYRVTFDKISRSESRFASVIYDQKRSSLSSVSYVYNLYVPKNKVKQKPNWVEVNQNNGFINSKKFSVGSKIKAKIIVKDAMGNTAVVHFDLQKTNGHKYKYHYRKPYFSIKKRKWVSRRSGRLLLQAKTKYRSSLYVKKIRAPYKKGMRNVSKAYQILWKNNRYRSQKIYGWLYHRYYKNAALFSYYGKLISSVYDFKKKAYRFSLNYSKTIFIARDFRKPKIEFPFIYGPLEQDEYFLKISDVGSGVNQNKFSIWIDRIKISTEIQAKWDIRFDKDRYGLLIPTGIKPSHKKYLGDESTSVHHLEIIAYDKVGNSSKKWHGYIRLKK